VVDELHEQTSLHAELETERTSQCQVILGGGSQLAHRVTSGHGFAKAATAAGSGSA
jgi:hypothetical protein